MRTSIGAAVVALLAFGAGALATSYFAGSSSVNAAQPAAASVPAVANGAAAPVGATALAPTVTPAVPTVQYITEPVATRTVARPARTRTVYRSAPASAPVASAPVYTASAPSAPRVVRHTRSAKNSAIIIGGSTVGGAGVGAMIGGKKGALIGGLLGGAAGTVYDRTTRHKDVYE